jgi:hypothetical protein
MSTLRSLRAISLVFIASLMLVSTASAQTTVDITYTWNAPTTGSPVDHYVVEVSLDGGPFYQVGTASENTYVFSAPVGESHQVRVAGVDASDRQGPYSVASEPYTPDLGPPGQPGQPRPIF